MFLKAEGHRIAPAAQNWMQSSCDGACAPNMCRFRLRAPKPRRTLMRKMMIAALCASAMAANAHAAVKEEPVTYQDGETTMKGFVVYDDAVPGKRPGIVMVHEWWGITKHIRNEAQKFAREGYSAFVADMYGDAKTADNPKDAGALSR